MADTLSRAEELVAQYETHMGELVPPLRDDLHLFEELKKPAQKQKHFLADSYLNQLLGMPYADFLAQADKLPEAFVMKKLEEVEQIKLGASLILAGFIEGLGEDKKERVPYLFTVDDGKDHQDVVTVEDNFAVIGSGSYVATPVMHQRDHDSEKPLMETIYTVYEAKRLAQVVPGVGDATSIDVMEPDGKMWSWSDALEARCKELFSKIGPKLNLRESTAKKHFEFKPEYLEPFDSEDKKAEGASA